MILKIRQREYEITPKDLISFNGKVYQFKNKKGIHIQIPKSKIKELQLKLVTKKIERFGVEMSYFRLGENDEPTNK